MPEFKKSKGFTMKGPTFFGSALKKYGKAPMKDYSVDKGSHDHPHSPTKHKTFVGEDKAQVRRRSKKTVEKLPDGRVVKSFETTPAAQEYVEKHKDKMTYHKTNITTSGDGKHRHSEDGTIIKAENPKQSPTKHMVDGKWHTSVRSMGGNHKHSAPGPMEGSKMTRTDYDNKGNVKSTRKHKKEGGTNVEKVTTKPKNVKKK